MNNGYLAAQHYTEIEVFHQFWEAGSAFSYELQGRPFWGICCILSGEILYRGKERCVTAKSGDVVILKKEVRYRAEFQNVSTDDILINFQCAGNFAADEPDDIFLWKANPAVLADSLELWNAAQNGSRCMIYSQFFRILDAITAAPPANALAAEIMRLIHADETFSCTDADLARACSVSVSTAQRSFQSAFLKTIHAYKNELRIEKAKKLLLSGNHSVEAVAEMLHYCDCAYFSRSFKRCTGLSPQKFIRCSAPV